MLCISNYVDATASRTVYLCPSPHESYTEWTNSWCHVAATCDAITVDINITVCSNSISPYIRPVQFISANEGHPQASLPILQYVQNIHSCCQPPSSAHHASYNRTRCKWHICANMKPLQRLHVSCHNMHVADTDAVLPATTDYIIKNI